MSDRPWLGAYPAGVPADTDPSQYPSLVALMEEAFSRYADRVAYSFMGKELTYSQVDAQSRAFAAYLQSLGLARGDRVALMMPNVPQYPVAVAAVLRAGFVVVNGGLVPPGGLDCFSSAFLPATHQGSIVLPRDQALANVEQREGFDRQRRKLDLLGGLDRMGLESSGDPDPIEGAIANGELAFRMQSAVPELADISGETEETRRMYGLEHSYEPTRIFARECLLARRMVERGVRFIELTCPSVSGDRWDQHGNLKDGHENNARAVDQPIGALLTDLKRRGMLEDTLVIWTGEFGRTPFAQGRDGRDHNPYGYTFWMAGGGVKAGSVYGSTDEFGYRAQEKPVVIYDFHATMLHILGVDHRRLTKLFGGREHRLTDVHGKVIEEWLA